jgi:hypothetical protein
MPSHPLGAIMVEIQKTGIELIAALLFDALLDEQ